MPDPRGHTIYIKYPIYTNYPDQETPQRPECRSGWFPEALGKGSMGRLLSGLEFSSQSDRDIWIQTGMLATHLRERTKCQKNHMLQMVNFKFYEFCVRNGVGSTEREMFWPRGHVKLLVSRFLTVTAWPGNVWGEDGARRAALRDGTRCPPPWRCAQPQRRVPVLSSLDHSID